MRTLLTLLLLTLPLPAAEPEHDPGDGGPATAAFLNFPEGIALDGAGSIYVSERGGNRVRRIDAKTKVITTIAGTGERGYGGDGGLAVQAKLSEPTGLVIDRAGNIYIGDVGNSRIRRVDGSTGIITTIAGTGELGFDGDGGLAINAKITAPFGLVFDRDENLYLTDTEVHRIRRLDRRTGIITTVVGDGVWGFGGDGGPATKARLARPHQMLFDARGDLIIGDSFNHRIRRVDSKTEIIETIAGLGLRGSSGDGGPAKSATFCYFGGLLFDARGDLIVSGVCDSRIRRIDMRTGVITSFTDAKFETPVGMASRSDGVYVVDMRAHRIVRLDHRTRTAVTVAGGKVPRNPVITWRFVYKREDFIGEQSTPVAHSVSGMSDVTVQQDVRYAGSDALRRADIYRPPGSAKLPVVILVSARNDTEVSPDEWGNFASRARLFAASGFAAVMFNHRFGLSGTIDQVPEDLDLLIRYLEAHANELQVDTSRVVVVTYALGSVAIPDLMRAPRANVKGIIAFSPVADLRPLYTWQAPGKVRANAEQYSMVTSFTDAPIPATLVIRGGKDAAPLGTGIDAFIAEALKRNAPVELINQTEGTRESASTLRRAIAFAREAVYESNATPPIGRP